MTRYARLKTDIRLPPNSYFLQTEEIVVPLGTIVKVEKWYVSGKRLITFDALYGMICDNENLEFLDD